MFDEIKLDDNILKRIHTLCKITGATVSELIGKALDLYLDEELNKWIPCKMFLPNDYEMVDVTTVNKFFGDVPSVMVGSYSSETDLWSINFVTVPNNGKYVSAWRKRPKPYKGG